MMIWFDQLSAGWKIGSVLLGLVLLGFLFVAVYLGLRILVGWRTLKNITNEKDRGSLKIEIIKTGAQILGGVFFLATLYFGWQNLVVSKEEHRTDLFTKAIEQLGSDKLEVRLGGIYALERIARDSEKDHWPIMEVLTAYVRENAPWPPKKTKVETAKPTRPKKKPQKASQPEQPSAEKAPEIKPKPRTDIQAILTVLARRQRKHENPMDQSLDLRETDLRGADLREAHLEVALLQKAHLEGADLTEANLKGAHLREANLKEADLKEANLEGAYLMEAHLEGANLSGAKLKGAILRKAHLEGADLRGAHLEGAYLYKARLEGANLINADLKGAKNLEDHQVRQARNWVLAFLPEAILGKPGLPPGHNQKLKYKDLSGYNLEGADLRGAYFFEFNLKQARPPPRGLPSCSPPRAGQPPGRPPGGGDPRRSPSGGGGPSWSPPGGGRPHASQHEGGESQEGPPGGGEPQLRLPGGDEP